MSKLQRLIADLCPVGVEYKCIGEIADCYPGATPKTSNPEYWENGTIPWMSSGEVNYGEVTYTEKKITQQGYDNTSTKMVPVNSVVIALAGQGKTRGTVAITRIPLCTNQSLCAIVPKDIIISEYLLHFLRSQYQQLRDVSSGDGTRGGLNLKMINAYKVPIPPLEVQREIVRILDNFTELTVKLTAELTAELTERRKQYEYYRNELLTFGDDVPLVQLGDIAVICRGASPRPISRYITSDPNGVNWIKIGDVEVGSKYVTKSAEKIKPEGAKKSRYVKKGDFILSNSMSFGRPYILNIEGCVHDGWIIISEFENSIMSDFLYHVLNSNLVQDYWKQRAAAGGSIQNLNSDIVKATSLPLPSFEEQAHIVAVLDKFSTLSTDISNALLAEITSRNKQYEYYRDQLLTFKEVGA